MQVFSETYQQNQYWSGQKSEFWQIVTGLILSISPILGQVLYPKLSGVLVFLYTTSNQDPLQFILGFIQSTYQQIICFNKDQEYLGHIWGHSVIQWSVPLEYCWYSYTLLLYFSLFPSHRKQILLHSSHHLYLQTQIQLFYQPPWYSDLIFSSVHISLSLWKKNVLDLHFCKETRWKYWNRKGPSSLDGVSKGSVVVALSLQEFEPMSVTYKLPLCSKDNWWAPVGTPAPVRLFWPWGSICRCQMRAWAFQDDLGQGWVTALVIIHLFRSSSQYSSSNTGNKICQILVET